MLWDDFVNSVRHDWRGSGASEDRLDKPEWLSRWVADHHLNIAGVPTKRELAALKRLRSLLLRIIKAVVAEEATSQADLDELNHTLAKGPVMRRIVSVNGRYQVVVAAIRYDWPQVMSDIAASFALALTEGEVARIRVCDNPDCKRVYYDETRNRSKRFCDDRICGNLMKVRRFRARQKAERLGDAGEGRS